ncbi:hypothetical protein ACLOJK_037059 [Asimina triloba]
MQLVTLDCQEEGISETQPILPRSVHALGSNESISSCEIRAVHAEYLDWEDNERFDVEEHPNLANDDQPQCRICLDIGGPYHLSRSVVVFLGMLVYKFYGDELREMFGYEEHPFGFYAMAGMHGWLFDCEMLKIGV